jgi:DNA (cytosine-5)-methyltransferase 1
MTTAATIFSGGGGADIGLTQAGLDVQWGLEYEGDIASVARGNGLPIRTGDVTDAKAPSTVDVLHASPPCPNFSVAKTGGAETDEDVSLARATVRFIKETACSVFTLENVWGYRKSQSWKLIRECLQRSGYDWNAWKLNAADYGVPQTRKRMIVAARKGGPRPKKPLATHTENPSSSGLFGINLNEWVGWHEAIDDLIADLPETELADWQKERLPDELIETTIVDTQPNARGDCRQQQPTKTVAADPAGGAPRAVLVQGMTSSNGEELITRDGKNPMWTENATEYKRAARAVLVLGGNASLFVTRGDGEPSRTISNTRVGNRDRAVMGRRVVQMTPRALARFQSFPDSYDLPDPKSLACRIIGNAVPPLLMKKGISHWLTQSHDC